MRAVWLHEFGPPDVLRPATSPDPVPGDDQVVIEVDLAGVTFVETQVRAGTGPFDVELPMVLGNGVGGTVIAVGRDASPDMLGRRVVSTTGGSGGYADRVVVDAAAPIPVPEAVPLDHAVALLADGRTANMLIEVAGSLTGQRVLIEAAAGGVGSLLVQHAIGAGATVVAAAGGKQDVLLELGAHHVVDYRRPDWDHLVREAVSEVDVVFDGVGGEVAAAAFGLLEPGGRMVVFGRASGTWAEVREDLASSRGVQLLTPERPSAADARRLSATALAQAEQGRLRPLIGQRFALDDAAAAHRAIESRRTVGKTLLETA